MKTTASRTRTTRRTRPSSKRKPAAPIRRRSAPRPRHEATHVAILGAGRGGTALIEILAPDPLVKIIGIAEINSDAVGLDLARRRVAARALKSGANE